MTPARNPLACEADGGLRRLKKWEPLNFQIFMGLFSIIYAADKRFIRAR